MARNHDIAINIGGDAGRGVRAVRVTREELARYAAESNRARQSVTALQRSNQSAVGGFDDVGAVVGKVGGVVAAVTGAWSGLSTIINAQIIRDNVALADAIDITVGKLQGWQYAGDRVGIAADKMGNILKDVTEKLGEFARNGGGEAKDVLEELGFAAKDFIGLQADEKLLKVAEAIGQMDDRGKQVSALEELGDDAARLLPLLERNAEKVKHLLTEASASGVSMSAEDIETVLDYADAWADVSGAMGGVQNRLTVLAGNTATDALHGLADVIRDNGDAVQYLDEAMIAGAGLMAARYIPAVADKTKAMYASQKAVITTAKAELNAVSVAERSSAVALRQAKSSQALAAQRVKEAFAVNATAEARNRAVAEAARKTQALRAAEKAHAGDLSRLTNVTRKYNAVATVTGRVAGGLKTALGVIGGPAGVALLAGAAILSMSRDYETAEERTKRLEKETRGLVRSLKNASLFDAYAAADSAAEAVLKKQEQLIKAKKALQSLEQKKPDRSYKGGAASHDDALEKTRDNIKALQDEYEALQRKAEVAGAGVDGALSRINTGTKTLTETTGKLTAEQIKLINKWAKQTTRVEQLRQQKKQLLATMDKAGELTDKNVLALENLNRELAEEAKRLKKVEDKKRPVLEQMQEELALLKAGEKAQYIANKLRGVSVEEMKAQGHQLAVLAGEMYDHEQSTKAVAKATKEATVEVDPFAEAWENAFDRLDDAGADLFKSMFQDMDSFVDAAKNAAQQFAGEWLYATAKSSFGIEGMFSKVAGGGGAGSGPAGSSASGFSVPNFSSLANTANSALDFFNPASGGTTAFINSQAQSFGYGMAADGMGPPSQLLIDPSGGAAAGLNAVGPGLAAFGLSQKHGPIAGVAGGAGSAALAGGVSSMVAGGGFMTGASGALAGLGPVGWGAIALGAILGALGPEPSDKTQWAGTTGGDGYVYSGGENGDKAWKEGRDAATHIAGMLASFDKSIEAFDGVRLTSSYEVGVGQRDGAQIRVSDELDEAGELQRSPNGSEFFSGGKVIFSGTDLTGGLDAAFADMAAKAGINTAPYEALAQENEALAVTYERVHMQAAAVKAASEMLGITLSDEKAVRLEQADQIVQSMGGLQAFTAQTQQFEQLFYTGAERQQKVYDVQLAQYEKLNNVLTQNGMAVINNADEYRAAITSMDGSTEAGAKLRAELMQYQQTVAFLDAAVTAAQESGASGVETFYDLQHANEDLTATIARVSTEFQFAQQMGNTLGFEFDLLGDKGLSVASAMSEAAGGLQQLQSDYNFYVNNILDAEQRRAQAVQSATAELDGYNAALELSGGRYISNSDQLQTYINGLDVVDDATAEAYATALKMGRAIHALEEAEQGSAEQAGQLTASTDQLVAQRKIELTALNNTATAQAGRNAALEEEQRRLQALAGIEAGYARVGKTFADVLEESISSRVAKIEADVAAAGGLGELVSTEAATAIAEALNKQRDVSRAESLQRVISAGDADQTRSARNELAYANQNLRAFDQTIENLKKWDYSTYRDELKAAETRRDATDDDFMKEWYSTVVSVMTQFRDVSYDPGNVDDSSIERARQSRIDNVAQKEISLESLTSGAYMQRKRDQLSQLFSDAGVAGMQGLYSGLESNLDVLRQIEAQYGIQGRILDGQGNIARDIADQLQFSLAEIEQFRTNFQTSFETGFANAMGIDTAAIGDQFASVADKYAHAAYSPTELITLEMDGLAATLGQFEDLGISTDTSVADFREAFDAVQGTVDGATLGRWWAAADAVVDYSAAQDRLNQALENGGALTAGFGGAAQTAWSDYETAADAANKMYRDRLDSLEAELQLVAQLGRAIDNLQLSSVSPLTPQQRMSEAKDQWDTLLAEVQAEVAAGDYSRVDQLQSAGESYITETQSVWGSGAASVSVFSEVLGALEGMSASLDSEDFEQRQISLDNERNRELQRARQSLEQQLSLLVSQNQQLGTMSDLLAGLPVSLGDKISAALAAAANQTTAAAPPVAQDMGGHTRPVVTTVQYRPRPADYGMDTMVRPTTVSISGSYRNGNPYVQGDEEVALLHKAEMVIPAPDADFLRSAGVQVGGTVDLSPLEAQLATLTKVLQDTQYGLAVLLSDRATQSDTQTRELIESLQKSLALTELKL